MFDEIDKMIAAINEQCDESYRYTIGSDFWVTLFNAETEITQGYAEDTHSRLRQIAKENGVQLD